MKEHLTVYLVRCRVVELHRQNLDLTKYGWTSGSRAFLTCLNMKTSCNKNFKWIVAMTWYYYTVYFTVRQPVPHDFNITMAVSALQ